LAKINLEGVIEMNMDANTEYGWITRRREGIGEFNL